MSLASGALRLKIEVPFYDRGLRAVRPKAHGANHVQLSTLFQSLPFTQSERRAEVPSHVA